MAKNYWVYLRLRKQVSANSEKEAEMKVLDEIKGLKMETRKVGAFEVGAAKQTVASATE